jgi:serine/threonine protein kinase
MYFISTKDAYRLNKLKFSANYCDFVEKCLERNVTKRWSIKKLLEHPFITQIGAGDKERKEFAEMVRSKKDVSIQDLMAQN